MNGDNNQPISAIQYRPNSTAHQQECRALVTCRIALGREDVMLAAKDDPSQLADAIAALDCRGNFMFDPATHRDFLGAILGTGVVREKVGVSMDGVWATDVTVGRETVCRQCRYDSGTHRHWLASLSAALG